MSFSPTPEQVAIIEAARKSRDNIIIQALAGAAKTTTLELICKAVTVPTLSLAFNKRIAEEMKRRLPGHVECKTLNGLGHGIWAKSISPRITLDTKKSYDILKSLIDDLPLEDRRYFRENDLFSETLKLIGTAKINGYVPSSIGGSYQRLFSNDQEFFDGLDWDPEPLQRDLVRGALERSITAAYHGLIDFDDQIYMATLFGSGYPRFPLVLVDEAQDLSPLNHIFIQKLVAQRLIVVGDRYQSIYGFRGAVANGMDQLKATFNMTEMPLSISFRCPRAVVEVARSRAPHMQYPEWAIPGEVRTLAEWGPSDIPDGAAVICRNNAPLFSLAFALLRAGRGIKLVGSDIGPALVKILKGLGKLDIPQAEVFEEIDRWAERELRKKPGRTASITDRKECLKVFAGHGQTLSEAITYAEHIFKQDGPVQLLSGHKSKGLEWENVFFLDPWRIPSKFCFSEEELEQELNVRYVIQTRAKHSLTMVDAGAFSGEG